MQPIKEISFKEFLHIFPEATLPIVISKDSIINYSRDNIALPGIALEKYIYEWDKQIDEFVEFIPCFRFNIEKDIHALVYYKASLLNYEYFLTILDKEGNVISRKIIAGLISNNETTIQSAATITEDFCIHIAGGISVGEELFDGNNSQQNYMEIQQDGQIVTIKDEENNVKNIKEKK